MSWLVGLGGLGVSAGLGVAQLQSAKKAQKTAAKAAAEQSKQITRAVVIVGVVLGFVLLVKVVKG
jgi:hypothetical protein